MALEAFLRVVQTVVGVLGIVGNTTVCVVIYKVQSMHTMTNAFIFNQAVVDFLASVVFLLSANIPLPVSYPTGPAGVLICRLWTSTFALWFFLSTSTFNLMMLTLERYLAIVFPFRYQALFGRVQATLAIVFVWLFGSIVGTYAAFTVINQGDKCVDNVVTGSQIFGVLVFTIQFFLPLVIMLVAYTHIAVTLKRSAAKVAPLPRPRPAGESAQTRTGPSQGETQDGSLMKARRNTFKALLLVFVAYVICWSPNEIIFFLFNFGWFTAMGGPLHVVSLAFVTANSCVNPVIYALKYRSFQAGLRQILGRGRRLGESASLGGSSAQPRITLQTVNTTVN
ncbi:beta-3 adrenergic receptor-like [Acanthaster planci]|uniref:Beta-3 adrenergic receptor-like n=1 Tax=Acanthaster planci TaxID=133434 RepID=A0A8B7ZZU8_ACAPL|nr:beta-3 adrenergic receptor-like [Acanthaster planci]